MKKKIFLLIAAFSVLIVCVFSGNIIRANIPTSEVCNLNQTTHFYLINCNGQLEESAKRDVVLNAPSYIKSIEASVGEYVEKGQVIARIDKERTLQSLKDEDSATDMIDVSLIEKLLGFGKSDINEQLESVMAEFSGKMNNKEELLKAAESLLTEEITAPVSGYLTEVNINQDVMAMPKVPVLSVSEDNKLLAKMAINEAYANNVAVGMKAQISGTAFEDKVYTGTVIKVFPKARRTLVGTNQETVVDVLIEIEDQDEFIKPGFSAKAIIEYAPAYKTNYIPYEAVLQDEDGNEFVYVFKKGRAVKQIIKTGMELKNGFEIKAGITHEDIVIKNPERIKKDKQFVFIINS